MRAAKIRKAKWRVPLLVSDLSMDDSIPSYVCYKTSLQPLKLSCTSLPAKDSEHHGANVSTTSQSKQVKSGAHRAPGFIAASLARTVLFPRLCQCRAVVGHELFHTSSVFLQSSEGLQKARWSFETWSPTPSLEASLRDLCQVARLGSAPRPAVPEVGWVGVSSQRGSPTF